MKKDMFLNILASLIATASIQLVCYPLLSSSMSAETYGALLTIVGLCNTLANIFGTSLNNVRLIRQDSYNRQNIVGDFNLIFIFAILISVCISFGSAAITGYSLLLCSAVGAISIVIIFVSYHSVTFRLVINYRKNLILNIARAAGYLFGSLAATKTGFWPIAFIMGEGMGCLYLIRNGTTVTEPISKTNLFKGTLRDYIYVAWGNCAGGIMMYMDRFMLFPLIGASSVAIYTVASYLGKSVGVLVNPISSVLLTYYSKDKSSVGLKEFYFRISVMSLSIIALFICIIAISSPVLTFLYPSLAEQATSYVFPASVAAGISVLCGVIQPMMLSYAESHWQTITQIAYLALYLVCGLLSINLWGLMGFCYAMIVANLSRLALMFLVTRSAIKGID